MGAKMSLLNKQISRRQFIKLTSVSSGAFLFGLQLPGYSPNTKIRFAPNAWIRIDADNKITFIIASAEMGQGVVTSLSTILAEELEVDVHKINFIFAPADSAYKNPEMGVQVTGGSNSIKGFWKKLQKAGAVTRTIFIKTAAQKWKIKESKCIAKNGTIIHPSKQEFFTYGQLVEEAKNTPIPNEDHITLKQPIDYKLIGKSIPPLDAVAKVTGQVLFGTDIKLANMMHAAIIHSPTSDGKIVTVKHELDPTIYKIVSLENSIAVVAPTYWQAAKAIKTLKITWKAGNYEQIDSRTFFKRYQDLAQSSDGTSIKDKGDADYVINSNKNKAIKVKYQLPYLAHATMEPMSCTAHLQKDRCDVYVGTQSPQGSRNAASLASGLPEENVYIHNLYIGGGFGRRSDTDFVSQAVSIAKKVGVPIKLIWSREEDMKHDFYRPASYHEVQGCLDQDGFPLAWSHKIVSSSIIEKMINNFGNMYLPKWLPDIIKSGMVSLGSGILKWKGDPTSYEGTSDIPYQVPNHCVSLVTTDLTARIGFWRSVGHSANAFVIESFLDELASLGKKDPYHFRERLLINSPRHLGVLNKVAKLSKWKSAKSKNTFQGIAAHQSFGSYLAQVFEISIHNQKIKLEKVFCAVDCGQVVNPDIVTSQVEGGIIFGLSAAIFGEITFNKGVVEQNNYNDYPICKLNQCPSIEVEIIKSNNTASGIGEPAVPLVAPALGNAIFAATGKRIRDLPFSKHLEFV